MDESKDEKSTGGGRSYTEESVKEVKPKEESVEVKDDIKEDVEAVEDKKIESVAVEEYEKVKKEAEEAKTRLSEMSNMQLEVEKTKNDLVNKVASALGIGEAKKQEDDIESLVQDEDKLYKHLQKSGYKGLVDDMRTLAKKDAQGIVQNILTNLSANATLYSEYPELKDGKSELSVKVQGIMKDYQLPNNVQGQRIAAKMAKLELGAMKVAEDVAGAVDDAKKGIQEKTDKTHVEINKRGIPSKKTGKELSPEQKKFIQNTGINEEEYKKVHDSEKTEYGRKVYRMDDIKGGK